MLHIKNFSYQFDGNDSPILKNINLKIRENQLIVITGNSGSGKSTLALAVTGFLFSQRKGVSSGSIELWGEEIQEWNIGNIASEVYLVQQNPENQFCTLMVQDEIAFGLENLGMEPEEILERIDWSLRAVDAENLRNRDLRTLSGGEQQKISIAAAIAMHPKCIILDEPTSFLDQAATRNIINLLVHLKKSTQLTLIVIEHKLTNLLDYDPIIYSIQDGELNLIKSFEEKDFTKTEKHDHFSLRKQSPRESIVEINHLRVDKGANRILSIDHLDIYKGDFISLLGKNGSGKTTLLYVLLGFLNFECDSCKVFGKNVQIGRGKTFNGAIGMVFQNPNHQFYTDMVCNELIFGVKNFEKTEILNSKWINELERKFSLSKYVSDHPLKLSYGQKKRLGIASVLAFKPELLLLDEIFIGQSIFEITQMMRLLRQYCDDTGATVILVNHQPEIIQPFISRTLILNGGKIVKDGDSDLFGNKNGFNKGKIK